MTSIRYSDLVLELAEVCNDISQDLKQRLRYYRASAYKSDAARTINERIDQLRAIFEVLSDDGLTEAMADHDAIVACGPQMLAAGDCSVTARVNLLLSEMDPALSAVVRRFGQSQSRVREETIKALQRHRNTLKSVCREGTRSWELLRSA